MKGIILAAGRGSRLSHLTDELPKCMMKIEGEFILHKVVRAFKDADINDVTVVTGYKSEKIKELGYKTLFNEHWDKANMISSLMKAFSKVDSDVIVSYADIVYNKEALKKLRSVSAPIAITYDPNWLQLWQDRSETPENDAETFQINEKGELIEIGTKVKDLSNVSGQFMGILKFSTLGVNLVKEFISENPEAFFNFDTTKLLSNLIQKGIKIKAVPYTLGWAEIDTPSDLTLANKMFTKQKIDAS